MGWLKPTPSDDRTPTGYVDAGNQNMSADDDDIAIRPFLPRLYGVMRGVLNSYYPSYAPMDGPHFRVGYQAYTGVSNAWPMQRAESDSTIGKPLVMRPPVIPRRNAGPGGVLNAITWVQSQPIETWAPIIPPIVARR